MKFSIQRELLLQPLQQVIGVVERRHTMPMLANILLRCEGSNVTMTATDLEVELKATVDIKPDNNEAVTLPARKLLDICRALPDDTRIEVSVSQGKAGIRAARSRFVLATLSAEDFPALDNIQSKNKIIVTEAQLRHLLDHTSFAMAQQDVRYYLNGLLLHIDQGLLRAVTTDGHRLAMCELNTEIENQDTHQVIIPRKGIQELQRLLGNTDKELGIELSANHIRVNFQRLCFTSKLIDGRFPDYDRVIPKNNNKTVYVDRNAFRHALIRTAILSSEKYRGVRLTLKESSMMLQAHNPDQEEAEEEVEIDYDGEPLEIGFNVSYLLDVLNALDTDNVEITFKDANSSALLRSPISNQALYVVMPMRL
jgi:DNA polymerase III subunit beta